MDPLFSFTLVKGRNKSIFCFYSSLQINMNFLRIVLIIFGFLFFIFANALVSSSPIVREQGKETKQCLKEIYTTSEVTFLETAPVWTTDPDTICYWTACQKTRVKSFKCSTGYGEVRRNYRVCKNNDARIECCL